MRTGNWKKKPRTNDKGRPRPRPAPENERPEVQHRPASQTEQLPLSEPITTSLPEGHRSSPSQATSQAGATVKPPVVLPPHPAVQRQLPPTKSQKLPPPPHHLPQKHPGRAGMFHLTCVAVKTTKRLHRAVVPGTIALAVEQTGGAVHRYLVMARRLMLPPAGAIRLVLQSRLMDRRLMVRIRPRRVEGGMCRLL